jgi:anthranilate synthase component 1
MISFQEFELQAKQSSIVPLVTTMLADLHTPVSAYLTLRDRSRPSFLFESVEPDERIGRHSFIGIQPALVIRARDGRVETHSAQGHTMRDGSIFDVLSGLQKQYHVGTAAGEDGFLGGLVGYLGYGTVKDLEAVPVPPAAEGDEDDAVFGLFTTCVRFDHRSHLITVIHNVIADGSRPLPGLYEEGRKTLETLLLRLKKPPVAAHSFRCSLPSGPSYDDSRAFCEGVEKAKEYIREGDIFQVVLSRRLKAAYAGDLFAVYRALRVINPSPYLFYLDFCDTTLVGSSPEVLVRVEDRTVEVLPIAGTRKRGMTPDEDRANGEDLLHDEKERAEHVMLVDLGRNDVGRVAAFGSVRVPAFMRVERYSHVMHLVSEVTGELRDGLTALDALRSCFPAGTVSGAPKVRAMEIISELEGERRGVYAGAVGYLGFNGALDMCIAIRTIVAHRDTLSIQAGAGIVADSVPEKEYQETVNKAMALMEAVRMAHDGLAPTERL